MRFDSSVVLRVRSELSNGLVACKSQIRLLPRLGILSTFIFSHQPNTQYRINLHERCTRGPCNHGTARIVWYKLPHTLPRATVKTASIKHCPHDEVGRVTTELSHQS